MLKLLSLFSGIGAFEKALENIGVEYDLLNFCEFDKYAAKSYCAIHNVDESKNLGDITKVDETKLPKNLDILTYGFPCQDISLAGKQKGLFNEDGTRTRSGLFFEALRIIEGTKPKIAIAENVKNLIGKKFKEQFQIVLDSLERAGYNNYYQVLNAKDYGVPQNRERVFIVSIRKDIDNGLFEFPKPFPLMKRLKDVLEESVDEKYYLTDPMVERLFTTSYQQNKYENCVTKEDGVVGTLCARDYKDPKCVQLDKKVIVREATKQGYAEAFEGDSINLEQPNSKTRRGRVGKQVAQTLTTSPQQVVVEPVIVDDSYKSRDARIYGEVSPTLRTNGCFKVCTPRVIGGIGEKKSNDGRQWYQQNRVYDSDEIATCLTTNSNPYYAVNDVNDEKEKFDK